MKPFWQLLFVVLALCASAVAAGQTLRLQVPAGVYGAGQTPAVSYSFSDVYRLTVSGAEGTLDSPGDAVLAELPMRVVAAEAPTAAYAFSITGVKGHERWLLVLTGLALSAWVARRRLVQAI